MGHLMTLKSTQGHQTLDPSSIQNQDPTQQWPKYLLTMLWDCKISKYDVKNPEKPKLSSECGL